MSHNVLSMKAEAVWLSLAALVAGLMLLVGHSEAAERRVALVVGIGAYASVTSLVNPPHDARAMAGALTELGFEVIEGIDLDRAALTEKLREFGRRSEGADIALAFYAGHGVQVDGENWLLPTDVRLQDRIDLEFEALGVETVLRAMSGARGRILLLDACRDNPFRQGFLGTSSGRSIDRGLARISVQDTGTLIAFATSPDAVAADGDAAGRHSPFTAALLVHMRQPGLEIRQMLTRTRQAVISATEGRQTPWENSSLLADVYLAGPPALAQQGPDEVFWSRIRGSENRSDFEAFARIFPESRHRADAEARLAALQPSSPGPGPMTGRSTDEVLRDCEECPEYVRLPGGSFLMGAPADDLEARDSEKPAHRVQVPTFAITRFPITFGEWQICVDAGACVPADDNGWGRGRRPVINVSLQDAVAYADWLSRETKARWRLPTEAEWEFAARAGAATARFWGDDPDAACRFANVFDRTAASSRSAGDLAILPGAPHDCADGYTATAPVGSFEPNAFGLYDMIGNVWQWTADCWSDDYDQASAGATRGCAEKVLRGGSWLSRADAARTTTRMRTDAADFDANIGFRLVREIP